jgi:hypothetical protein
VLAFFIIYHFISYLNQTERISSILPRPGARSRAGSPTSLSHHCPASSPSSRAREGSPSTTANQRQAVRSLGPLGFTCYQASTCGLSTRSSPWDLDCLTSSGKTYLGCGFALRCCQRLSLLDIAIQLWGGHPNWRTSGRAISVLSYWR